MKNEKGQLLIAVIMALLFLAIVVPAMVVYVQNEAKWSVKQAQSTSAFQFAEAGLDRALRKVSESTTTWQNIQNGTIPAGYVFDTTYTDLNGGSYTIGVSSGPGTQEATIVSAGRDILKKETRAIKALYANSGISNVAIRSGGTTSISGSNTQVEWGSIVSDKDIATNSRNHPQFWSAANVTPQDANGNAPPNCDSPNCWQWHSFQTNIPPAPSIDFAAYKAAAQGTGTYFVGPVSWPGAPCASDATSCNTGNTYYIDGDLNIASPGIYVLGNLIVIGNLNMPNGRSGQGGPTVPFPQKAWQQYGNDWAYYLAGGPACSASWNDTTAGRPATYPGKASTYVSDPAITVTFSDSKVFVNGFLYVGGNWNQAGGGGQTKVAGAAYVVGNVNIGSNNVCVFNTAAASQNLKTTKIVLVRESWQDKVLSAWPGP